MREALAIFRSAALRDLPRPVHTVLVSGLGGSGIGGSILAELCSPLAPVPVLVTKEYALPSWVNGHTLVIISSYSGNTEETLQVMRAAVERGSMIVCVTSGGTVLELAKEQDIDALVIPGGHPPRACLGYSLTQLCGIMERYDFAKNLLVQLESSIALLERETAAIQHEAESIARGIAYSLPVLYSSPGYEGVSVRLRQQLNENAKMLCWHHVVPEMNHNELVGWVEKSPKIAALFLRNDDEYYRTAKRMELCREIISQYAGKTLELHAKGSSHFERVLYWIHLGDWISWFASVERNQDAMEINVINRLKGELSSLK